MSSDTIATAKMPLSGAITYSATIERPVIIHIVGEADQDDRPNTTDVLFDVSLMFEVRPNITDDNSCVAISPYGESAQNFPSVAVGQPVVDLLLAVVKKTFVEAEQLFFFAYYGSDECWEFDFALQMPGAEKITSENVGEISDDGMRTFFAQLVHGGEEMSVVTAFQVDLTQLDSDGAMIKAVAAE